jgi:transglutaminase-like putative cysteine protease
MTVTTVTNWQLSYIPSGDAGTRATLSAMSKLAREGSTTPLIRQLALRIVSHLPEKKFYGEVRAVLKFVQDKIRYVRDVSGVETLAPPRDTLALGQGDCDDKSILLASLLLALGNDIKFVAVDIGHGQFSHVLPKVKVGDKWLFAETINKGQPLGKGPKNIVRIMEHRI